MKNLLTKTLFASLLVLAVMPSGVQAGEELELIKGMARGIAGATAAAALEAAAAALEAAALEAAKVARSALAKEMPVVNLRTLKKGLDISTETGNTLQAKIKVLEGAMKVLNAAVKSLDFMRSKGNFEPKEVVKFCEKKVIKFVDESIPVFLFAEMYTKK